jgi:transcription initiation factor TFIIIB Brf1 subunit/transcription initiation factor TFIIB
VRSYSEYIECSCGAWARIVRAEDKQHRDKIVCAKCGRVTVMDNIPMGIHVELVTDMNVSRKEEDEDDAESGR